MEKNSFWLEPEAALAHLCQSMVLRSGLPVHQIAQALHKGEDLIYKWCNPNAAQLPSLLQFLEFIRITRQYWALAEICAIFEHLALPRQGEAILRALEGINNSPREQV